MDKSGKSLVQIQLAQPTPRDVSGDPESLLES